MIDLFLQGYFRVLNFGVENYGISFGIMDGVGMYVSGVLFLVFAIWMAVRLITGRTCDVALILIFWGGLGNVLARILGGSVWDYLTFPYLPFWFNLSDTLISAGTVYYLFREIVAPAGSC